LHRPIKIGIVGGGMIAPPHAEGYLKLNGQAEIVSICDKDENLAKLRAKEWGCKSWYTEYNEMLRKEDLDAIDVMLPHHLHVQAVKDIANAGKHILLEKPIGRNLEEANEIINIVKKANIRLMIANNMLFHPTIKTAINVLRKHWIGDIALAQAYSYGWFFYTKDNFRLSIEKTGGGCFIDNGLHFIYILKNLIGPISSVSMFKGHIFNKLHEYVPEGEDHGVAIFIFKNGALGEITISFSTKVPGWKLGFPTGWEQRVDIYGSEGAIRLDLPRNIFHIFTEKELPDFMKGWNKVPQEGSFTTSYHDEVKYFIDCLLNEKEFMEGVTPEAAMEDLRIALACYKSAETGKVVRLD
jgi:predicted dehydrogenase